MYIYTNNNQISHITKLHLVPVTEYRYLLVCTVHSAIYHLLDTGYYQMSNKGAYSSKHIHLHEINCVIRKPVVISLVKEICH